MYNQTLTQEILSEIGNQSLKRLNFNIVELAQNDSNDYLKRECSMNKKALISLGKHSIIEIQNTIINKNIEIIKSINRILSGVLNDIAISFTEDFIFNIDILFDEIFDGFLDDIEYILKSNIEVSRNFAVNTFKYMRGEISLEESLMLITRNVVSHIITSKIILLEKHIYAHLVSIMPSFIAEILSKAFSIITSAFAIVMSMRVIESIFDILLIQIVQLKKNKMKLEEIEKVCEELIPKLTEDRNQLIELYTTIIIENDKKFTQSFEELQKALSVNDVNKLLEELSFINNIYGHNLGFNSFEEFDEFTINKKPLKF